MWTRTSQGAFFSFSLLKPSKNNLRTPKHQTPQLTNSFVHKLNGTKFKFKLNSNAFALWHNEMLKTLARNYNFIVMLCLICTQWLLLNLSNVNYLHVHFVLESMAKTSNKNHDYLQLQGDFKVRDNMKLTWVFDLVILCHVVRTWPIIYFTLY